ncbi:MAG: hypothetical protein V1708_03065 [Candidatus Micrarchaeota archaeon]
MRFEQDYLFDTNVLLRTLHPKMQNYLLADRYFQNRSSQNRLISNAVLSELNDKINALKKTEAFLLTWFADNATIPYRLIKEKLTSIPAENNEYIFSSELIDAITEKTEANLYQLMQSFRRAIRKLNSMITFLNQKIIPEASVMKTEILKILRKKSPRSNSVVVDSQIIDDCILFSIQNLSEERRTTLITLDGKLCQREVKDEIISLACKRYAEYAQFLDGTENRIFDILSLEELS